MKLAFAQMDEANARAVLTWRYDEPYSFYHPNPAELEKDLQTLTDPDNHYYMLTNHGALVAYYCFGRDAQVAGGDYSDDALDIGGGVRPDLTGRGFGSSFIQDALDFGQQTFAPRVFRVTVAAFNQRASRSCKKIGFSEVSTFLHEQDKKEFVILRREA